MWGVGRIPNTREHRTVASDLWSASELGVEDLLSSVTVVEERELPSEIFLFSFYRLLALKIRYINI
jgi:hypothetical protein